MRFIFKLFWLLTALVLLGSCAGTYQPGYYFSPIQNLAQQIDRQIASPELETALVGIMVQSAATGEILYQHNANTLMMPASNEKIVTSAAALVRLGPDFRYQTQIYTNGTIENGILNGDLIIKASGDPIFAYRFCSDPQGCFVFKDWADSLRAKGITSIRGDIIGIDDIFDDEPIGYGWTVNNLLSLTKTWQP